MGTPSAWPRMSQSAISTALMAELRIGPPRQRGLRNIPCQSSSMSVGSLPTRKRSCSRMAAATVASLLVTEPSPSPTSPWLVCTLQNTQLALPAFTTKVLRPVIFRLSAFACASSATGAAPRSEYRKERRFIATAESNVHPVPNPRVK